MVIFFFINEYFVCYAIIIIILNEYFVCYAIFFLFLNEYFVCYAISSFYKTSTSFATQFPLFTKRVLRLLRNIYKNKSYNHVKY